MSKFAPVYLIDGSTFIYRAYHAIRPLSNADGLPTHAILGFTNTLLKVIREKKPQFLAVAFDSRGPTFRHKDFPDYKANRPSMPDDLISQIPYVKQVAAAYNILSLEQEGVEADDIIASAVSVLSRANIPVVVVSGDKDLLQLISETVILWDPMKDIVMDQEAVQKKYQVTVAQLTDLFTLLGDTSDNIPGVPGIGPKTGAKLINDFGSFDSLYAGLDKIENLKLREKLRYGRDQAIFSRHLITLKHDVPVPELLDAYRLLAPDHEALRRLFAFLGFGRLIKSELPVLNLSTAGFNLVSGPEELAGLVQEFSRAECLTVDLETTSLDPVKADIVGISLCIDANRAYYLPIGHREKDGTLVPGQLEKDTAVFFLRPLLADPKLPKLGHNLKYDYSVLLAHGIFMAGPLFDTMVASYLLNPARSSHKLDDLGKEILERRLTSFVEVTGASSRDDAFAYVLLLAARDYSCEDVRATFLLWETFAPELKAKELWDLFVRVEMPLVPILAEMEYIGIRVDPRLLAEMSKEFAMGLETLEREIYTLAGQVFNINSPRQLGEILFERLGLPHGRKTKTGYSTDLEVLEKLANFHELPAAVLSFRNLSKLKSTYVDALASLIHPVTGRIHTSFNQTVTATGRLSSSRPNLQNIPVRTREGQRIREAFIPADGYTFLGGDYSQIELRVLAHYSKDKEFVAAFHKGEDIHAKTAQEIFRTLPGMVTPEMRRVAKTINFGIIYGMSAFGLSSQLNISRKEAQVFIDRYFELYSGVREFMDAIIKKARKDRLVTTLLGRRRLLPDILSPNKNVREFAERTAINTPIQGTAADIIKLAMQQSHTVLKVKGLRARMILQIHDELVFEVPDEELAETSPLVQQAMEGVMQLNVPLVVNISAGKNLAAI